MFPARESPTESFQLFSPIMLQISWTKTLSLQFSLLASALLPAILLLALPLEIGLHDDVFLLEMSPPRLRVVPGMSGKENGRIDATTCTPSVIGPAGVKNAGRCSIYSSVGVSVEMSLRMMMMMLWHVSIR